MAKRISINEKVTGVALIGVGLLGLVWGGVSRMPKPIIQPIQAVASVQAKQPEQAVVERTACKVLIVYDGDTLGCDLNADGEIEKPEEEIRLLGVDSPEMHYSRKNPTYRTSHPVDEPFAKEASRWLTTHAKGKMVYLEFDRRRQDKYDRTLAHVFAGRVDRESLNAQLLAQGYATLLFLGKNRLYEAEYQAAETRAREAKRGLWH